MHIISRIAKKWTTFAEIEINDCFKYNNDFYLKIHDNQAFKLTNKNFICEFNAHIPVEAVRSMLIIGDEEE